MISLWVVRRYLLPLILLSAPLCFAGQGTRAVAASGNQTEQPQAERSTSGISAVLHPLHGIKFHLGTVRIGGGYSYFTGPSVLPLYYSYAYPFWGSPYWGPLVYPYSPYSSSFQPGEGQGQVKLRILPATAEVLINNAYAGTVAGLKGSFWLKPGVYDLCVRAPGRVEFRRRIYVLTGKKIKIEATLSAANGPHNGKEER